MTQPLHVIVNIKLERTSIFPSLPAVLLLGQLRVRREVTSMASNAGRVSTRLLTLRRAGANAPAVVRIDQEGESRTNALSSTVGLAYHSCTGHDIREEEDGKRVLSRCICCSRYVANHCHSQRSQPRFFPSAQRADSLLVFRPFSLSCLPASIIQADQSTSTQDESISGHSRKAIKYPSSLRFPISKAGRASPDALSPTTLYSRQIGYANAKLEP